MNKYPRVNDAQESGIEACTSELLILSENYLWMLQQDYSASRRISIKKIDWSEGVDICQCGSEMIIKKASDPELLRSELIAYTFTNMFVHSHFYEHHDEFRNRCPGPVLIAHVVPNLMTPDWFLYERHGYDKHADYALIANRLKNYLTKLKEWLIESQAFGVDAFEELIALEIKDTFPTEQSKKILIHF